MQLFVKTRQDRTAYLAICDLKCASETVSSVESQTYATNEGRDDPITTAAVSNEASTVITLWSVYFYKLVASPVVASFYDCKLFQELQGSE